MKELIAWISSIILTIGVVWRVFSKYSPKIKKSIEITDEILDIARKILNAIEDKKVTKEEIEYIMKEVEDLQELLQK